MAGEADLALKDLLLGGLSLGIGCGVGDDDGGALATETDSLELFRQAIGLGLGLGEGLVGDDWIWGLSLEFSEARAQRLGGSEAGGQCSLAGSKVTETTDLGDDGAIAADLGDDALKSIGGDEGGEDAFGSSGAQRLAGGKHEAALLGDAIGGRDKAHVAGLNIGDARARQ